MDGVSHTLQVRHEGSSTQVARVACGDPLRSGANCARMGGPESAVVVGATARRVYPVRYNQAVRPVRFLGDSLKCLRDFPDDARHDAGYQLDKVQRGIQPDDFKPMPSLGKGVEEIRVFDQSGAFRVIYVARRIEAVYVLHAFQKKTQSTSKMDLDMAKKRYRQLMEAK